VVAVAASLVAFQPLRSPWWTGHDFDSVYAATGLTLFRGDRSNFYDHPGAPLQEGLGLVFTGAWLVGGADPDRAQQSEEWVRNLDSVRPYLRAFAVFTYVAAVLIGFLTIAWVTRSAFWGFLGGLLVLTAPDLITWSSVVKPDPLLAGLSVAVAGLLVEAFRRRSGALFLAAAFVLGFDLSVKVQAAGLALPFALALVLRPPPAGWWTRFRHDARAWIAGHRSTVFIAGGAWLGVVTAVNAFSAAPELKPLAEALGGTVAVAVVAVVGWLAARRTRLAGFTGAAIGSVFACLAGLVVPNLFYVSFPAPMLRQMAITVTGGGVNSGAHPALEPWDVLTAWRLFLLFAAVGLVYALMRREWDALVWASGAFALGLLAYLRFGEFHYYASAIAVAAPLVLRALQAVPIARLVVAGLVVAAIVYQPYRDEIDRSRSRGDVAARTERVNGWVEPRLRDGEVALTYLESSDSRHQYIVDFYSPWNTIHDYRFLPASPEGVEFARDRSLRVAYLITGAPADASGILRSFGLSGEAVRARAAPGFVYRVV
jgi:hypothetical protein